MRKIFSKLHETTDGTVLACCDKELVGKTLKDKKTELRVFESFYKGRLVSEKELEGLFEQADSINLLGEKSVGVAVKKGLAGRENIKTVNKIPHVQIYKV